MWPFISLSNHIMMNTKYHDAKVLDAMQSWDFWQMKPRNEKVCQGGGKYEICKLSKIIFFLLSCKQEDVWYQWELRCDGFHSQTFFRRQISFSSACEKILHVSDTSFFISQSDHLVSDLGTRRVFIKRLFTSRAPIFYTELFFHSGGSLHSSLP